jgi:hypothetical protein
MSKLQEISEKPDPREDLIRRVGSSPTFEKSPRLRTFFLYVCQCVLDNRPEGATEQQIGIHVFGRPPGYNASEDNIVRSQARLLRWKLEHHFANEGKDEPLVITIPKGQYLPVFESRPPVASPASVPPPRPVKLHGRTGSPLRLVVAAAVVALGALAVWLAMPLTRSKVAAPLTASTPSPKDVRADAAAPSAPAPAPPAVVADGGIRIAAGLSGGSYVDAWGHRWDQDRYYRGGAAAPGARDLFPPVPDPGLFRTSRQGLSASYEDPTSKRQFAYDIPVRPGVYELRIYFADPNQRSESQGREDSQNIHHLQVELNGRSLLWNFDPVADAAPGAVDIRAFKDVSPAADGMVHLEFVPSPERPFVNAIELIPAAPGKINPIRICAGQSGVVESDGTRWSGDNFFIHGRTTVEQTPEPAPQIPPYCARERFGNFSYAIPVPPGSYTVKLHFMESFFSAANPSGQCQTGEGCRVFDVTCDGVALLQDFDIYKAAGGGFKPVVRSFKGLHPNGQGKLMLTFSSKANYAEVRAIEVLDEGK